MPISPTGTGATPSMRKVRSGVLTSRRPPTRLHRPGCPGLCPSPSRDPSACGCSDIPTNASGSMPRCVSLASPPGPSCSRWPWMSPPPAGPACTRSGGGASGLGRENPGMLPPCRSWPPKMTKSGPRRPRSSPSHGRLTTPCEPVSWASWHRPPCASACMRPWRWDGQAVPPS